MALWALVAATAHASDAVRALDVEYTNGDVELAALLLLPASDEPVAAAVIIQGSGTSDRSNRWSRDMAELFVANGVAALLTDKRGSGASGGDWRTVGFDTLAADALAGVDFLKTREEIDPRRIGLVGLSQGGQVAPVAAAGRDDVAFVVSISSKAVGFAEGSFLEMANTARQSGLDADAVSEVLAVNLALVRYLATGDWQQYVDARERALSTAARDIAAGYPADRDAPIWQFFRKAVYFDPLPHWLQVAQPAMIVYGELDERDNAPVAESVRRLRHVFDSVGKDNDDVLVVPGVGHGIRDPETHRLSDAFTDHLAEWLSAIGMN